MLECKICGETFEELNQVGLCTRCARETNRPVKLPSAAIMTKEGYEKAIERVNNGTPPPPSPSARYAGWGRAIGIVLFLSWLGIIAWAFQTFELSTPFTFWVLCSGFFLLGLAMILSGRVTIRRAVPSDKLEPAAQRSLHLIVGVFWIIPLLLYVFFFAQNTAVPRQGQLWFVGIMLGIALVVQMISARAFTPVD